MNVQFKRRWGSISVVTMLSIVLAACGGSTGSTTTSSSGSASGAASGSGGASSPAASTGTSGSASSSASTGGSASSSASASGSAGASASGGAATGSGAAAACPASAQGAQITMWSPLTGPDGDEMTALANQFSSDNPQGIKVQHAPQPQYDQKLTTAAAGNTLPDMSVVRYTDVPVFAARNLIKPMGDEALSIVGGESLAGEFPEALWNSGEYNGQRYSIPLDVNPLVLYYNKDMFQQAGITMPTDRPMTKEEFEAAADKLNTNGVAGYAQGTLFNGNTMFETLINQFGGSTVNEDGTEATYNSPEGVEALTYLQQLKQKYSPNIAGQGDPEVKQFQARQAAMVIHGPWHISDMVKLPFVGFAQVPQFGETHAVQGGSHQLALTTEDPAKQAAAACWIAWLSENSAQWAKSGLIPIRESVRDQIASVNPVVGSFAGQAESLIILPPAPGLATALGVEGFERAITPVLLGQETNIQGALDQAAQRSNQVIQQNQQQYGGSQ